MILTEAEAMTKWCPFVRLGIMRNGATVNRAFMTAEQAETQANTNCIGSVCMCWRRSQAGKVAVRLGLEATEPLATSGYCGLAGTP